MSGNPAVDRAARILDFLATHPSQRFTMSELSRRLEISKATCHLILMTLTAKGYVVRHPTTLTYTLGPALIPLATVAERELPAITHARQEATALAERFEAECSVTVPTSEEQVVVATAGTMLPGGIHTEVGQRTPLIPPLGSVFIAWADQARVDRWIAQIGPERTDEDARAALAILDVVRRRGYLLSVRTHAFDTLAETVSGPEREIHTPTAQEKLAHIIEALRKEDYLASESSSQVSRPLTFLSAPVFGPEANAVLALSIHPQRTMTEADAPMLARDLLRATARVMKEIDGRVPLTYSPEAHVGPAAVAARTA